jgi:hypothetical protein
MVIAKHHAAALLCGVHALGVLAAPHVHGVVALDVALEGPRVVLSLKAPLDSLVGFERAPRTDAERRAAADVPARLREPDALFKLDPATGRPRPRAEPTGTPGGGADRLRLHPAKRAEDARCPVGRQLQAHPPLRRPGGWPAWQGQGQGQGQGPGLERLAARSGRPAL